VPESGSLYFTNARAIGSTLTGYTSGSGVVAATDTILQAIQKLNGNVSGLVTGVSSVFGRTGAVVSASGDYTTTQVTEGTNLYYTEGRVSANTDVAANTAARHAAVTIGTANGLSLSTQALSLAAASTSATGALTSTDWNTFNNKLSTATAASTYVPYTGATGNVTLGTNSLTAGVGSFASSGGSDTFAINHSSGSGIALNITKGGNGEGLYINKTSGSGNAATIVGNLGGTSATFSSTLGVTGALSGTSILLTSASNALTLSNASNVWLRVQRGTSFTNIGVDTVGSFYNTNTNHTFYVSDGTIAALNLASTGAATFSSSVTQSGFLDILGGSLSATNGLHMWYNTSTNIAWIQAFQAGVDWRQINYNGAVHNFLINDVSTLYVSNSRNVGIGVTSPAAKFEVTSGVPDSSEVQRWSYNDGNAAYSLRLKQDVSTGLVKHVFDLVNNGTTYSNNLVLTNGNVGIGTISPSDTLHLERNGVSVYNSSRYTNSNSTANFYVGVGGSGVANGSLQNNAYVYNAGASALIFGTSDTERARITSGGSVLINRTTNPYESTYKFILKNTTDNNIGFGIQEGELSIEAFNDAISSPRPLRLYANKFSMLGGDLVVGGTSSIYANTNRAVITADGVTTALFGLQTGGVAKGYFYTTGTHIYIQNEVNGGNIYATANSGGVVLNSGATSWTSSSDERLKNITGNIDNAINSIMTLRTIKHTWKSDKTNKEHLALIAQDVEKVFPQVIDKNLLSSKPNEEQTDETEYLGVRYTELIPVLVKAIQELKAEIDELKNK
jgi:hypothetical protein